MNLLFMLDCVKPLMTLKDCVTVSARVGESMAPNHPLQVILENSLKSPTRKINIVILGAINQAFVS
jgi:hypothetical protein